MTGEDASGMVETKGTVTYWWIGTTRVHEDTIAACIP
jgi:hypothetical protein